MGDGNVVYTDFPLPKLMSGCRAIIEPARGRFRGRQRAIEAPQPLPSCAVLRERALGGAETAELAKTLLASAFQSSADRAT
jgi:hypothetical protein